MPKEKDTFLTTPEAAKILGITRRRVGALIQAGRLKAARFGRVWQVRPADLAAVANRKPGRPVSAK